MKCGMQVVSKREMGVIYSPFMATAWRDGWPLLCYGVRHVHGAPPLFYSGLWSLGSSVWGLDLETQ
jgi:hypothetical protein